MDDVFGTAGIRERVLAGWAASAARFREDANAEEDLALGGYRDRLVVELAQNAADAAVRAGIPGRVRFTLYDDGTGPALVVANTGAPLTAEGVESLATLRASAKRDDPADPADAVDRVDRGDAVDSAEGLAATDDRHGRAVGRFGVGFAAVLAVTDEPVVLSRTGGVRFSRADTAAAIQAAAEAAEAAVAGDAVVGGVAGSGGVRAAGLGEEVRRRDGQVPVLRLPFEAEGEPPEGFDTAVLLPLRDEAAADLVRRLLAEADDALLLALPGLDRIEIDADGNESVLTDVAARWHVHRAGGTFTAREREELLADRPTEERSRPYWSVLWALPKEGGPNDGRPNDGRPNDGRPNDGNPPRTVHAPTPTDEPLSLPALLLASFPLEPARRHVADGPLTDRLVTEAASAYVALLRNRAEQGANILPLVPTGLAAGVLDGSLREAITALLPDAPLLRPIGPHRPPPDPEGERSLLWATEARPAVDAEALLRRAGDESAAGMAREDMLLGATEGAAADGASDGRLPGATDGRLVRGRDAVVVEGVDEEFTALLGEVVEGLVGAGREDGAALRALGVRRLELAELVEQLHQLSRPPEWWRELYGAARNLVGDALSREALGAVPVPLVDGRTVTGARGLLLPGDGLRGEVLAALAPYGLRVVHPDAVHETLERLGALRAGPRSLLEDGAVRAAVEHSEDADDPDAIAEAVIALAAAAGAWDLTWLGDLMLPTADGDYAAAATLVIPGSAAQQVLDDEEFAPVDPALVERHGAEALEAVGVLRMLATITTDEPDELDLDDIDGWLDEAGAPEEIVAVRDLEWVTDWPRALTLFAEDPELRAALVRPGAGRPSYTSWWIRRHGPGLAGLADPDADRVLLTLLDPAPGWVSGCDPEVRAAIGLVRRVAELDRDGIGRLLHRLADEDRAVPAEDLLPLWSELGALTDYPGEPPSRIRVLDGVVDADDAVVADAPMWLQRKDLGGFVVASGPAADGLADLLDLPLASDVAPGRVESDGTPAALPATVLSVLPQAPETWYEHDELVVDGNDVSWWVTPDGRPHAATTDGLAKALAWSAGAWHRRHEVLAVLTDPDRATGLLLDTAFDSSLDTTSD